VIEIFKTNIRNQAQARAVYDALARLLPAARISFDLDDPEKILRVEDDIIDADQVMETVKDLGYGCKIIPDQVCKDTTEDMRSFWDNSFIEHREMWGFQPSVSARLAREWFVEKNIQDILIPGIGYGRNAAEFIDNGIKVTGIEISATAVEMAAKHYGSSIRIYEGSVTDMPFDDRLYEGIFCHGLLYLLNAEQRRKMIADCYRQLKPGGWMIFTVISRRSPNYGKGEKVAEDTFRIGKGGELFFYDEAAAGKEFEHAGLTEIFEIEEPHSAMPGKPPFRFLFIKCTRK
jgi:SAM-dependent methyltransferase